MDDKSIDDLKEFYETKKPNYERLGSNITRVITNLLDEHSILHLKPDYRVKGTQSFLDKIVRKAYANPLEDTEDICGVRIICYYNNDVNRIREILEKEFEPLSSVDKEELLDSDQFGYRSHHLIVKIKEGWLSAPEYRGLKDLKAEIQIRTILMHTWAEIEHKLGYKKKEDIPPKFRRKFSSISAILEVVDEQFESLKKDINTYRLETVEKMTGSEWTSQDKDIEMDIDTLQIFIDKYLYEKTPTGEKYEVKELSKLLAQLKKYKVGFNDLFAWYTNWKDRLDELEKAHEAVYHFPPGWDAIGVIRVLMMIHVDGFLKLERYPLGVIRTMQPFIQKDM